MNRTGARYMVGNNGTGNRNPGFLLDDRKQHSNQQTINDGVDDRTTTNVSAVF